MEVLVAVLAILVAIAILYELARRLGVPFPTLMVLGGLGLAFVPGLPTIALEPELVLLVFLPPLLFSAAVATPRRDLRANLVPIARLSIGLVVFTMVCVAVVAHAIVPDLGWGGAFALGAIVAPTDALAATSVFRRLGAPRVVVTLIEGESLFNDASALVAYRAAVLAVVTGSFVLSDALVGFFVAAVGGIALGIIVGRGAVWLLASAGRPAGRGRDLPRHPVRRLPAGRRAGAVRRPGGGHRRPRGRWPAGDDPHAEQPGPVAEHLEDDRLHPQRLRLRAHRPRAPGASSRASRAGRRARSWAS